MAKVTGPLGSFGASGKIGNHTVHFAWKGIQVARQWLKPSNPKSADQGDVRVVVGGIGRACGRIRVGKIYAEKLNTLGVIPDQQTKQSYMVQYIKDQFVNGAGATMTGNYASILAEITGHTSYALFQTAGESLSIADFDLTYAAVDPFEKALGVYLLAKAAIRLGFTGSPYSVALSTWTATTINELVSDLITS